MRNESHPILGKLVKKPINFTLNGDRYSGIEGDSIASALLANGVKTLRYDSATGEERGLFCGIGHCYECRVDILNKGNVRACITPLEEGMEIKINGGDDHEL